MTLISEVISGRRTTVFCFSGCAISRDALCTHTTHSLETIQLVLLYILRLQLY